MAERERDVAKKAAKQHTSEDQSLIRAFFGGFFWPFRLIWRGLKQVWRGIVWLSHRAPLKQIGHGLRWFFRLRAVRFVGRFLGFRYIRDSAQELRNVTWPTFRESMRLTGAVILFSIIFGALIAVVDYGLDKVFRQILLK